jgi:hypothetical protein
MIQILQETPKVMTVVLERGLGDIEGRHESIEVFNPQGAELDMLLLQISMKTKQHFSYLPEMSGADLQALLVIEEILLIEVGQRGLGFRDLEGLVDPSLSVKVLREGLDGMAGPFIAAGGSKGFKGIRGKHVFEGNTLADDIDEKVDQDAAVAKTRDTASLFLNGLDPIHIPLNRFHQNSGLLIGHLQSPRGIVG